MVNYQVALELIDNYQVQPKTLKVDTLDSLGYVLAEPITSPINVPSFRKSAMDGYAIPDDENVLNAFTQVGTIYAGDDINLTLEANTCVKIMTGAPLPTNCNRVIVKELASVSNDVVTFNIPNTKLNDNVCQVGEDIQAGQQLFTAGTHITPTIVSSLISCGVFSILVYQKPNILLVTTGDEVVNANVPLNHGQIYNSNLAYLKTRLASLGFNTNTIHLDDTITSIQSLFDEDYDFIITTGAISVGDRDIIRKFIDINKPQVIFDRINIMPGGPVVFWEYNKTPIISLAGSPFANFVTFELFARRILAKLTNDSTLIVKEKQLTIADAYTKVLKKRRFLKAHIQDNIVTIPASNHLASSLHEMTMCNCLINLERGDVNLKPNDTITVLDLRRNYE